MTVRPGLCSVTFRQFEPDQVIGLTVEAGLSGIEWGADVHLPPGDLDRAERVARRCADAGLATPSYGSYLRAGEPDQAAGAVFDTATALGATTVRVWAGRTGSADADAPIRHRVAGHLASLVAEAAGHGLTVALESHEGTLTDTAAATLDLFADVGDDRLLTYWQPRGGAPPDRSLAELRTVGHRLAHVHVFWWNASYERLPLADGDELWTAALPVADECPGDGTRFAFLEFVPDDDPVALRRDANVLRRHLERLEPDES
jgi:sugar phosphate isomerase/epimerase